MHKNKIFVNITYASPCQFCTLNEITVLFSNNDDNYLTINKLFVLHGHKSEQAKVSFHLCFSL